MSDFNMLRGFAIFTSTAPPCVIRARHPALREALVEATLDSSVRSIGYEARAVVGSAGVAIETVILQQDDARFFLDGIPARPLRDLEEGLVRPELREHRLQRRTMTKEDLRLQPRRGNAAFVWTHRGRPVPVGIRVRVLQALRDDGPMELGRLLEGLLVEQDPAPAVLAMACADLLELDLLSAPLGPDNLVRAGT
jgi:hypothetical protein